MRRVSRTMPRIIVITALPLAIVFLVVAVTTLSIVLIKYSDLNTRLFQQSNYERFLSAILDASIVRPEEVNTDLIPINDANPYICWRKGKSDQCTDDPNEREKLLVVSWMVADTYKKYYGNQIGETDKNKPRVWVTVWPEVQNYCRILDLEGPELSLRIKQYLGLHPDKLYEWFVELWVNRTDLFRPCPDPNIDDTECDTGPVQNGDFTSFQDWFSDTIDESYRLTGSPWTRLGYTYDWGNPDSNFGASEFVLKPGVRFERKSAQKTGRYCDD